LLAKVRISERVFPDPRERLTPADLRAAMQRAGVIGMPDVLFLDEVDRQPA